LLRLPSVSGCFGPEHLAAQLQRLLEARLGLVIAALVRVQKSQGVEAGERVWTPRAERALGKFIGLLRPLQAALVIALLIGSAGQLLPMP
jgi:hypothetical protein